jgi:uncharacterized membrane protein YccF (DUF307 family)
MRFILNVIWFVLAGLWLAIGYVLAGIVACILIVTIPFGIAAFRIAAGARASGHGRPARPDDHRHPARRRQFQDHPDYPGAARSPHRARG